MPVVKTIDFLLAILVAVLLSACTQEESPVCVNLYGINVLYSKNNVPRKFDFAYRKTSNKDQAFLKTIFPIEDAIDFGGMVQFKSDSGFREFHISYVDPGEEKKIENVQLIAVDSLSGKMDSASVENLWGTGSIFSSNMIVKEKWREMRFLTPLFVEKDGKVVDAGYACSDWHTLREVTEPKCKVRMVKSGTADQTLKEQLSADSLMKRIKDDVDAILDCFEENF